MDRIAGRRSNRPRLGSPRTLRADSTPGVEPAVERGEGAMCWCGVQAGEAYSGIEESAARVEQRVAHSRRLLNHLIRPPQRRRRDGDAEGFGGLEVDDELEFRGLLDREIARSGALQDPIHVLRKFMEVCRAVRPVTHQSTLFHKAPVRVTRRQAVPTGELDNPRPMSPEQLAWCEHQRLWVFTSYAREDCFKIFCTTHFRTSNLEPQRPGRGLCNR